MSNEISRSSALEDVTEAQLTAAKAVQDAILEANRAFDVNVTGFSGALIDFTPGFSVTVNSNKDITVGDLQQFDDLMAALTT